MTAGDDRVREGHRVLEGVRLPKEDPFWKKYFPPNGWNCRCTTLEIWKDEPTAKIDFGITGRDPRKRTPSAMNVPAEFRGNVGIFATPKISSSATKNPSKTVERTYKKPKNERIYYFGESTNHATGGPSENPVKFSVSPTYAKTPKRWTKIKEENPSEKERERAEIYASSLFRFNGKDSCIPVSFANLDSETINYYCSTLHTVVQELPIVRNLVSKIHVRTDSLGLGSFDIEERSLGLSMTSFKEMKETCKQKFNSRPRHFSTADVRATVFHEIGHALFTEILSKKQEFNEIAKIQKYLSDFAKEGKFLIEDKFVSWYASNDEQELVAEVIACFLSRKTSKVTSKEPEIPAIKHVIEKIQEALEIVYPGEKII